MSFYIEKIIVTGSGKTDSIIELSNGVNIIYGPSNTGKTYIVKCIDYMFGSEREPIDISTRRLSIYKNNREDSMRYYNNESKNRGKQN